MDQTERVIRAALAEQGGLGDVAEQVSVEEDLYARGLTSLGSVRVMLAIEAGLSLEFPENLLVRELFATIANLMAAAGGLLGPAGVADGAGAQS